MSELSIPERVAAGAAWLDMNRPGWMASIELNWLDIRFCSSCVLGQVYGHYLRAPRSARYGVGPAYAAETRGFYGVEGEMDELTAEWRRLIESRRGAVSDAS